MTKNTHRDGHITPLPFFFFFFFLADSHYPPCSCLTQHRNSAACSQASSGRETILFYSPVMTRVLGLCFLEESLICSRSQRLVSRRNMVPML